MRPACIVGTDGDDQILLRQIGKAISISGADGSWLANNVHSIVIDVRAGDDFVSLNSFANGGNKVLKEKVSVWSGDGVENIQLATNHSVRFGGVGHHLYVAPGAAPRLDNATLNLSSSINATISSGVLTITGTNAADNILLRQSSGKIFVSGLSGSWAVSKVKSIVINLQDGDDYVSLDSLANGGNQVLSRAVTVNSGNGSECVHLANGRDVSFSGLGHVLHAATDGTVTLDAQVLSCHNLRESIW